MTKALTVKHIAKLTEPGRYRDPESRGLYLQVGRSGTKSWLLRYELGGRERFMGLGALSDFTLKEARERARAKRQLLTDGIDPIEQKRAERRAREQQAKQASEIPTFKAAAETYFRVHGPKWRNQRHAKQFMSTLQAYAFPKFGNLRVDDITTEDVRRALEPIWHRIPSTASRVRGRIENVLSWAIATKYREGPNPARWADNLEHLLPALGQIKQNAHHAALPYAEMPAFWAKLAAREGVSARALAFTILTAARTGETLGAKWSEIDLKERTWTIPANRIKGGQQHKVPLTDAAIRLLETLPTETGNDHVFVGQHAGVGLSHVALAAVLRRMGRNDVTTHGFRSTFSDWAHEQTSYDNHTIEQSLAHKVGNAVERAYRRGDMFEKRRRLMSDWARYCKTPAAAGEVVPIRTAR
jgi:integrase